MPDPGAKSGAVSFVTQTVGLANYVVFKPEAGQLRLDQAFTDGAVIKKYMVTNGADISIERGTVSLPDTLTRDAFIASNTGSPISWPETGQRTVWPLVEDLPLCDIEPTDGQVLVWNEAEQNWCPGDVATLVPCSLEVINIDSGVEYDLDALTQCETQLVWNSTTVGSKLTRIPAAADYPNRKLEIKANVGDGTYHCVVPPEGTTIGGLPHVHFDDNLCNLSLVANADKNDWLIKCLCCYTPEICIPGMDGGELPPPPEVDFIYPIGWDAQIATPAVTTVEYPPGPVFDTIETSFGDFNFLWDSLNYQNLLYAITYVQGAPAPSPGGTSPDPGAGPPPSVVGITDTLGLDWQRRVVARASGFAVELWYAYADIEGILGGTPNDGKPGTLSTHITIQFDGPGFIPFSNIVGMYRALALDTGSGPAVSIDNAAQPTMPGFSTVQRSTMILAWFLSPAPATPIAFVSIPPQQNAPFINWVGLQQLNLNQTPGGFPTITVNGSQMFASSRTAVVEATGEVVVSSTGPTVTEPLTNVTVTPWVAFNTLRQPYVFIVDAVGSTWVGDLPDTRILGPGIS